MSHEIIESFMLDMYRNGSTILYKERFYSVLCRIESLRWRKGSRRNEERKSMQKWLAENERPSNNKVFAITLGPTFYVHVCVCVTRRYGVANCRFTNA